MDEPPHVPQLGDDPAACLMDCIGDEAPALDLRLVPQAGRVRPAEPFAADAGGFRDDQAGIGALRIIFGHERIGNRLAVGAGPRQRRHDDAVAKLDRAERNRIKQAGHEVPFLAELLSRRPMKMRTGAQSFNAD